MTLKCRIQGKFYFFKKQRKGRLYNRISATTGLVKPSVWRKDKEAKNMGHKRQDKGSAKTVNINLSLQQQLKVSPDMWPSQRQRYLGNHELEGQTVGCSAASFSSVHEV